LDVSKLFNENVSLIIEIINVNVRVATYQPQPQNAINSKQKHRYKQKELEVLSEKKKFKCTNVSKIPRKVTSDMIDYTKSPSKSREKSLAILKKILMNESYYQFKNFKFNKERVSLLQRPQQV